MNIGTITADGGLAIGAGGTVTAAAAGFATTATIDGTGALLMLNGPAATIDWAVQANDGGIVRIIDPGAYATSSRFAIDASSAMAFGFGEPNRTLRLSLDHAVLAEAVLIPVRYLFNATTIVRIGVNTVTYYRIELDRHDVVLAEGLPCESYLDIDGRAAFEASGLPMQLHPGFALLRWETAGYASLTVTGPAIETVRLLLSQQAATRAPA